MGRVREYEHISSRLPHRYLCVRTLADEPNMLRFAYERRNTISIIISAAHEKKGSLRHEAGRFRECLYSLVGMEMPCIHNQWLLLWKIEFPPCLFF